MGARHIAEQFVSLAFLEWGQTRETKLAAVQRLLDEAGFDAHATCWPVFDGLWLRPCKGREGPEATEWLSSLTSSFEGRRQDEKAAHVEAALLARARRAAA